MSRRSIVHRALLAAGAVLLLLGTTTYRPAEAAVDPAVVRGQATRLYKAYFLREPDPAGLQFWVGRISGGMRLQDVSQFFAESDEFRQRYGSLTNGAFVDLVYKNVLGRAPDPGGRAHWAGGLDTGKLKRGGVMIGFSESPEFVKKTGTTPPPAPPTTPPPTSPPPTGCATAGIYVTKNGVCVASYEDAGGDVDCPQLPAAAKPVVVPNVANDPYDLDGNDDGVGCERT